MSAKHIDLNCEDNAASSRRRTWCTRRRRAMRCMRMIDGGRGLTPHRHSPVRVAGVGRCDASIAPLMFPMTDRSALQPLHGSMNWCCLMLEWKGAQISTSFSYLTTNCPPVLVVQLRFKHTIPCTLLLHQTSFSSLYLDRRIDTNYKNAASAERRRRHAVLVMRWIRCSKCNANERRWVAREAD